MSKQKRVDEADKLLQELKKVEAEADSLIEQQEKGRE